MSSPTIRALQAADWLQLREIRLFALRTECGMYFSTHEEVAARDPAGWRALISDPGQRIFGLFAGGRLAGITAVYTDRDDPTARTALLANSYILPAYRRRGLTALFYAARLGWIRARPEFARIKVSHRASNAASGAAIRRHGFVEAGRNPRTWPDGARDDEIVYEIVLA